MAKDMITLKIFRGGTNLAFIWVNPKYNHMHLYKREAEGILRQINKEDTQKRRQCDHRGRDYNDVASNQGMPTPEAGKDKERKLPLEPLKGDSPANTLISYIWPPEL